MKKRIAKILPALVLSASFVTVASAATLISGAYTVFSEPLTPYSASFSSAATPHPKIPTSPTSSECYDSGPGDALRYARLVADRIVDNTVFGLEYILQPVYPDNETVDFGASFRKGNGVAYALSTMTVEADQTHTFEVGGSGDIMIWIDGEQVFCGTVNEFAAVFDEKSYQLRDSFTVDLKKGDHQILVKSAYGGDAEWLFILQGRNMSRHPEKGKRISFSLKKYAPKIKIASWLVLGAFDGDIDTPLEPENTLELYKVYEQEGHRISWNIPRVNIVANNIGGRHYYWSYHTGGFAWALRELSDQCGITKYSDYAGKWCDYLPTLEPLVNYQVKDLYAFYSMNFGQSGRPMLDYISAPNIPYITRLARERDFDNEPTYRQVCDKVLSYLTQEQFRFHGVYARSYTKYPSVWADDMFMGLPFLVYASKVYDNPSLLEDAVGQLLIFSRLLCDPATGLYRQACYPSYPRELVPFWSRGNGWAIWATTEVLMALDTSHPAYDEVLDLYRHHIDALVKYQSAAGYWHNVLDMKASDPESSGTAIFTMAIARGINQQWLDKDTYMPFLNRSWNALRTFIDDHGVMHGIAGGTNFSTDVRDYLKPLTSDDTHGIFPFIFACIELDRLAGGPEED